MADSSLSSSEVEALRRAVQGDPSDDVATLIWRAGEMRRWVENAHSSLDMMDAPRSRHGGTLTLSGRLDVLRGRF